MSDGGGWGQVSGLTRGPFSAHLAVCGEGLCWPAWGVPTASRDGSVAQAAHFRSSRIWQQSCSPATPMGPFLAAPGLLGLAPLQIPSSRDLPAVSLSREHALVQGCVCWDSARAARGRVNLGLRPCSLLGLWERTAHPPPSQIQPGSAQAQSRGGWVRDPGAGTSQFTVQVDVHYPRGWQVPDWVTAPSPSCRQSGWAGTLGQAQILEVDGTWVHSGLNS